jgi:hypothetical protein
MWLMTTRGFYSAVQHRDDPDRILVRARCRRDLDAIADLVPGEPVLLEHADYAWRVETDRATWRAAVAVLAAEIDYPNFKSAVTDHAHHDAYMRVWSALLPLDDR